MSATEWSDIAVAVFTGSLAAATFVLAIQTRRAVKADTDLLTQAARQASAAEAQAALTSKIFAASDRPALTLPEGQSVFIEDLGSSLGVDTVVLNYGTGVATFDRTLDDPRLKFYWVGTYDVFAKPERIVIMRDSNARVSFVADKSKVIASVPAARPDGTTPGGLLDVWYTDISRTYKYRAVFTLDLVPRNPSMRGELLAELKVSDIRYEGPFVFAGEAAAGATQGVTLAHTVTRASEGNSQKWWKPKTWWSWVRSG